MIFSVFDFSSPFYFLLIEFHNTFFISYNVLPYYVYYYCILIVIGHRDFFFFCARFASFHTHASLLTFFVCFFILFHSCCSQARVFGKTLLDEFHIQYIHTEWYLFFSDRATTSAQCAFGAKN